MLATGVGFLLDMDGTLVDSHAVVEDVWRQVAADHGLDADAVLAYAHGRPTILTVDHFLSHWPTARRAALAAEVARIETGRTDGIVAVPGAGAFLAELARLGAPVALVTSATPELAANRMRAAGLPLPRVVVTPDDVSHGKPDPEPYLTAAAQLGVDPTRCVAFEDAEAGMLSAERAGTRLVVVGASLPASAAGAPRIDDFRTLSVRHDDTDYVVLTEAA